MRKDGGPAFPSGESNPICEPFHEGMTLRDWFAGLAMQSLINTNLSSYDLVADEAYQHADAMLKIRKGGES